MVLKRKKFSIKWKVFIYLIGFTTLLLGLIWFLQIVNLNAFYERIKKQELQEAADSVLSSIKSDTLEDDILGIADNYDISINLVNSDGKSICNANIMENSLIYIFDYYRFAEMYNMTKENGGKIIYEVNGRFRDVIQNSGGKPDMDDIPELPENDIHNDDKFAHGGDKEWYHDKEITESKSIVYAHILTDADGNERLLLISSLITPVDATVYALRKQFIYISAIVIVAAILVGFMISGIVSKPIVKINDSAKKLAKGDFDVAFEGGGYKEIQELSSTLNYAAVELGSTEKLRRELIANVSHDLRTPLTMITAYAEVMKDIPGENNPENIRIIIDEAKRLTTLVNDMLDLSKLQAGVQEINCVPFDFTRNIVAVLNRFAKFTEQNGYKIEFDFEEDVKVYSDEYKIYQVIYNLINNAINYAGEDKTVIVRQIVKDDIVRLEVEDHGKGISDDELDNIWERYYKVEGNHKRAVQGTGLGLSIVKNILQKHNANFGVNSNPGNGSTFWFELQVYQE